MILINQKHYIFFIWFTAIPSFQLFLKATTQNFGETNDPIGGYYTDDESVVSEVSDGHVPTKVKKISREKKTTSKTFSKRVDLFFAQYSKYALGPSILSTFFFLYKGAPYPKESDQKNGLENTTTKALDDPSEGV